MRDYVAKPENIYKKREERGACGSGKEEGGGSEYTGPSVVLPLSLEHSRCGDLGCRWPWDVLLSRIGFGLEVFGKVDGGVFLRFCPAVVAMLCCRAIID